MLTWPIVTVFGFIAKPHEDIFLKPRVTQVAAEAYGFDFEYRLQGFIWVQGSDEY